MKGNREQRSPSTLVLMPALNEEKGIGLTLAEFQQHLDGSQFIVIDGHSSDRTVHVATSWGADVLYQKGKGDAVGYALRNLKDDYDYVVLTDCDYTYPAEYVPRMIRILEENPKVGMVCGNRFNARLHVGVMNKTTYFGNRVLAIFHNLLNGVALLDPLTGLRVIRGSIIKDWQPKSTGFDIEVELNRYVERRGYQIAELDILYRERVGQKKLKTRHGWTILKRMILEVLVELLRQQRSISGIFQVLKLDLSYIMWAFYWRNEVGRISTTTQRFAIHAECEIL